MKTCATENEKTENENPKTLWNRKWKACDQKNEKLEKQKMKTWEMKS